MGVPRLPPHPAPLAGNALLSFVPGDRFVVPAQLLATVRAAKCVKSFQEDRNKCARLLEEVLQFAIAQKKGLGRSSLLHQSRSEEMNLAISNFEEQVWAGAFLPKWERIVQRIIARPKIKVERRSRGGKNQQQQQQGGATEGAGQGSAAAASAPAPAPRESTSSDGAARVLSNLASSGGSGGNGNSVGAHAIASSSSSIGGWDTSHKGTFTKAGQALLTQWFIDHITDPYPKDHEKHDLARAAKLSYDQISAWMINARMRKWVGWIAALQAGDMSQSAAVAAGSVVGPKPGSEGAEYRLKRIEAEKASKAGAAVKKKAAGAGPAAASKPKPKKQAPSRAGAGASKGRKKGAVKIESESEEEGGSDFSEEEDEEEAAAETDEDESMDAVAAGPRRSTRERKPPAGKQSAAALETSDDEAADDEAEAMMKEEEMPAQDDDDDEEFEVHRDQSAASNTAAAGAAAAAPRTVPAGSGAPSSSFFLTHSPPLSASSSPAPFLSSSNMASAFLDPLAQYVFSGSTLAPFNVLSLTAGQHAQLTLPTMGGALSDSALAMSMSGPMPAMDSAAGAGDGATIGAGLALASGSSAAAAAAAAQPTSTQPLRSSDAMLMSMDPLTTSIAHLQHLQYQLRCSGGQAGLNMSGTGLPYPPLLPPMLQSFNHAAMGSVSMGLQHSGGSPMQLTPPQTAMGMQHLGMQGAMGGAAMFAPPPSSMQPPQPSHSNPSSSLLLGRVPAPFVSGVPLAFTGAPAPASRNASPAQMSLVDSAGFNESLLMGLPPPRSSSTAAASSASSSSASTPAPTFGAFRFG